MSESLKKILNSCKWREGDSFSYFGKTYMWITGMIVECIETKELFMKSIDF